MRGVFVPIAFVSVVLISFACNEKPTQPDSPSEQLIGTWVQQGDEDGVTA